MLQCTHTLTQQEHKMRDAILAKLAEVEAMLEKATCDGEADVPEVGDVLNTLVEAVDYYVD